MLFVAFMLIFSFSELVWVYLSDLVLIWLISFCMFPLRLCFVICDILPQLVWVNTQTF